MKTKLIGYKISIGEMDDESNPKNKISYNSRTIRFITDMGETSDNIGFDMFDSKFKRDELARILCVSPNDKDVNDALSCLIGKDVNCFYAPVYGQLKCVGFAPVTK